MTAKRRRRNATTALLPALLDPACYPHPVAALRVIETHISWIVLTGEYAYKIKKPVNLGFADFSTLERRRRCCEEELRLNRRLAPQLYLEVVTINAGPSSPRIGGDGDVLEYAVKMREFPQDALAAQALGAGRFGAPETDALAERIAAFHGAIPAARDDGAPGAPAAVLASALQNFDQMAPVPRGAAVAHALRRLREWTGHEFRRREPLMQARRRDGCVRECHGDLHLGNIALIDGRPVPFDCIEFNEELRWIDVMSEAAFLTMDLEDRGRPDLGWRFLNRYLEITGDYAGLGVLRFYLAYRALVRAKVHLLRSRQARGDPSGRARLLGAFREYVELAARYAAPARPALIVAHGLSGSGKTTATQPLLETIGAMRLRSDIERKRLHGLAPLAASGSPVGGGIYTREATAATYRRLDALARDILKAGFSVIVDAAFLRRTEREAFRAVAEQCDALFLILDFHAPLDVLRARVVARRAAGSDASEAGLDVLERQIGLREPLTPAEMAVAVAVDGTRAVTPDIWHGVMERLKH